MHPEPVTPTTPRPVTRTVFTQRWRDLAFLHWAVDPAQVQRHLPPDTRPDTVDGATYVGLIPFRMRRIGLLGLPGLPYLGSFAETNVRLYSVDEQGRRGVVFASGGRPAAAGAGRTLGGPAALRLRPDAGHCRR